MMRHIGTVLCRVRVLVLRRLPFCRDDDDGWLLAGCLPVTILSCAALLGPVAVVFGDGESQ